MDDFDLAYKHQILYYSVIPIREAELLNTLIKAGYAAARVSGELAHHMNYLSTLPIEIRLIVNSADTYDGENAMKGTFVRPEDLPTLADTTIQVAEFYSNSAKEEQALFRIYAEDHQWAGGLGLLVKDLERDDILNRMIPPSYQERRNNCGMKCQYGGTCNYCNIIGILAKKETYEGVIKNSGIPEAVSNDN